MTLRDLVPASELAKRFGVKALGYGPPGSGKTPLLDTLKAWNPVVCVTEPGFLSMAHSSIACYPATTPAAIEEFGVWASSSHEAQQFGVKCIDSSTEMAEIFLKTAEGKTTKAGNDNRGKQAYGEMAREVKKVIDKLYFTPGLHLLCIAKENAGDGTTQKKPFFPGQDLNTYMPHRFDWVFRVGMEIPPGQNQRTRVIRSRENFEAFARERTGRLDELEPPDLLYLIQKLTA